MARGKDNARRYRERRNALFASHRSHIRTRSFSFDEKLRETMRNALTIATGMYIAKSMGVPGAAALLSMEREGIIPDGLLSPQAIKWATEIIKEN